MSSPPTPTTDEKESPFIRRRLPVFQTETGQSFTGWAALAALSFITQIIFRRELAPGEFGTLNTALGMIGLMTLPVLAVNLGFTHYLARPHAAGDSGRIESLRTSTFLVTETFAWIWGAVCMLLLFVLLPLLDLPRFSLQLFTLMNVLVALGGLVSWTVCRDSNQLRLWAGLLAASALARVLLAAGISSSEPWAESGLAAFLLAGFITLTPALRPRETDTARRLKACQAVWDHDFLLCLGATFSVLLALFLFSSADRIVAQRWVGNRTNFVSPFDFDAYQTAGLLARSLLWGTQPLLWILFAERSRLDRTTPASLFFFWIHLGALVLGVVLLFLFAHPLDWLFCGTKTAPFHHLASTADLTSRFVPSLAMAMIPLGLLQSLGIFSLASRRYPECFVLGGCSVGYLLVLFLFGQRPELMVSYMFGGGLVALMIVLFVGVTRWGRKQP